MRIILTTILLTLLAVPAFSLGRPPGMPDRLDIETWLIAGQRITTTEKEDPQSVMRDDPIRYVDLDGDNQYEIILLAEVPDEKPDRIPPEQSWLYVFVRSGRSWDRMLLHDAGEGRFRHLAFPDLDGDGKKEILYSMSSAYVPDYDRFAILQAGGYYYRPWVEHNRKIWIVMDLNGDGKKDIVTQHRFEADEYLIHQGQKGFKPVSFESLRDNLRLNHFTFYKELLARQEKRLEKFGVQKNK